MDDVMDDSEEKKRVKSRVFQMLTQSVRRTASRSAREGDIAEDDFSEPSSSDEEDYISDESGSDDNGEEDLRYDDRFYQVVAPKSQGGKTADSSLYTGFVNAFRTALGPTDSIDASQDKSLEDEDDSSSSGSEGTDSASETGTDTDTATDLGTDGDSTEGSVSSSSVSSGEFQRAMVENPPSTEDATQGLQPSQQTVKIIGKVMTGKIISDLSPNILEEKKVEDYSDRLKYFGEEGDQSPSRQVYETNPQLLSSMDTSSISREGVEVPVEGFGTPLNRDGTLGVGNLSPKMNRSLEYDCRFSKNLAKDEEMEGLEPRRLMASTELSPSRSPCGVEEDPRKGSIMMHRPDVDPPVFSSKESPQRPFKALKSPGRMIGSVKEKGAKLRGLFKKVNSKKKIRDESGDRNQCSTPERTSTIPTVSPQEPVEESKPEYSSSLLQGVGSPKRTKRSMNRITVASSRSDESAVTMTTAYTIPHTLEEQKRNSAAALLTEKKRTVASGKQKRSAIVSTLDAETRAMIARAQLLNSSLEEDESSLITGVTSGSTLDEGVEASLLHAFVDFVACRGETRSMDLKNRQVDLTRENTDKFARKGCSDVMPWTHRASPSPVSQLSEIEFNASFFESLAEEAEIETTNTSKNFELPLVTSTFSFPTRESREGHEFTLSDFAQVVASSNEDADLEKATAALTQFEAQFPALFKKLGTTVQSAMDSFEAQKGSQSPSSDVELSFTDFIMSNADARFDAIVDDVKRAPIPEPKVSRRTNPLISIPRSVSTDLDQLSPLSDPGVEFTLKQHQKISDPPVSPVSTALAKLINTSICQEPTSMSVKTASDDSKALTDTDLLSKKSTNSPDPARLAEGKPLQSLVMPSFAAIPSSALPITRQGTADPAFDSSCFGATDFFPDFHFAGNKAETAIETTSSETTSVEVSPEALNMSAPDSDVKPKTKPIHTKISAKAKKNRKAEPMSLSGPWVKPNTRKEKRAKTREHKEFQVVGRTSESPCMDQKPSDFVPKKEGDQISTVNESKPLVAGIASVTPKKKDSSHWIGGKKRGFWKFQKHNGSVDTEEEGPVSLSVVLNGTVVTEETNERTITVAKRNASIHKKGKSFFGKIKNKLGRQKQEPDTKRLIDPQPAPAVHKVTVSTADFVPTLVEPEEIPTCNILSPLRTLVPGEASASISLDDEKDSQFYSKSILC